MLIIKRRRRIRIIPRSTRTCARRYAKNHQQSNSRLVLLYFRPMKKVEFGKVLANTIKQSIVWSVDPKTNLDVYEPYKQSLSSICLFLICIIITIIALKFIFELHTVGQICPKDALLEVQRNIKNIVNLFQY